MGFDRPTLASQLSAINQLPSDLNKSGKVSCDLWQHWDGVSRLAAKHSIGS